MLISYQNLPPLAFLVHPLATHSFQDLARYKIRVPSKNPVESDLDHYFKLDI